MAEDLRYPIGKFTMPEKVTDAEVENYINDIESLPGQISETWNKLTDDQKESSYREGGWTARQVVHHLADSHINAFVRSKLALTEDNPTIKPYKEELWAQLEDAKLCPPEVSIHLLTALHLRWSILLRSLGPSELDKTFYHPESKRQFSVRTLLALYSWHGRHHLGHLKIIQNK